MSAPAFPACASAATSKPTSPPAPRALSPPPSTNSSAPTAGTVTPLLGHNESRCPCELFAVVSLREAARKWFSGSQQLNLGLATKNCFTQKKRKGSEKEKIPNFFPISY